MKVSMSTNGGQAMDWGSDSNWGSSHWHWGSNRDRRSCSQDGRWCCMDDRLRYNVWHRHWDRLPHVNGLRHRHRHSDRLWNRNCNGSFDADRNGGVNLDRLGDPYGYLVRSVDENWSELRNFVRNIMGHRNRNRFGYGNLDGAVDGCMSSEESRGQVEGWVVNADVVGGNVYVGHPYGGWGSNSYGRRASYCKWCMGSYCKGCVGSGDHPGTTVRCYETCMSSTGEETSLEALRACATDDDE